MKKVIDLIDSTKLKIKNSKIAKFYNDKLSVPVAFVTSVITWSIFVILLMCAAFLIYYYVSMQRYAKHGAGYEPEISLYTIVSGSMKPAIDVYDVVVVFDVNKPQELAVGDVISYNSSDFIQGQTITVTHRISSISQSKNGEYTYYTKGDNNFSQDAHGISFNQILGRVELKVPQLGRIQFFLASKFGWLVVVVIPALFIIIKYIVQLLHLSELGKKVKKDSIFFPLFHKQLQLPYKEKLKINMDIKDDNVIPISKIDETPINKKSSEKKELKKYDSEIKLDNVFEYFKNLTK